MAFRAFNCFEHGADIDHHYYIDVHSEFTWISWYRGVLRSLRVVHLSGYTLIEFSKVMVYNQLDADAYVPELFVFHTDGGEVCVRRCEYNLLVESSLARGITIPLGFVKDLYQTNAG